MFAKAGSAFHAYQWSPATLVVFAKKRLALAELAGVIVVAGILWPWLLGVSLTLLLLTFGTMHWLLHGWRWPAHVLAVEEDAFVIVERFWLAAARTTRLAFSDVAQVVDRGDGLEIQSRQHKMYRVSFFVRSRHSRRPRFGVLYDRTGIDWTHSARLPASVQKTVTSELCLLLVRLGLEARRTSGILFWRRLQDISQGGSSCPS